MRRAQRHGILAGSSVGPGSAATSTSAGGGRARRRVALGVAALLALAVTAAGCGANNKPVVGNIPVMGGAVNYALPANVTPNYIFPFEPAIYFTVVNTDNLSYLLYRPLYWFGDQGLPYPNSRLSLAYPPQYNGQVVTIKLKPGIRWSNGTFVTARDVVFWMNMMKAERANWGGYVPNGLPDNVKKIRAVSTNEVQMTIIGKYSPLWFSDNELSQITPMPQAWDVTSPSKKSDCTDHVSDCTAVYNYLYGVSKKVSTWVTSPLWNVVDGPWKLTGYNSQGVLTFTYNRDYSLHVPAHHVTTFREIPFTSEQAEFNQIQAGGSNPLDVGYLPTVDAPVPSPGQSIGQNPVSGYQLHPVYTWGLSYIPYNFNAANPQRAIFEQQYFRTAFQLLVNQAAIIQGALHGYGVVSTGPVGDSPQTNYLSADAKKGDPFPYNLQKAKYLLTQHGWLISKTGVTKCISPGPAGAGHCGYGVRAGTKLDFSMLFATGNAWVQAAVLQLKTNASYVGIQINLKPGTFNDVISTVSNGCGTATAPKPCPWELADWGQGWSYVPDYLPTGDELFQTGSLGNIGQYSSKHDDRLIKATLQAPNLPQFLQAMYAWERWLTPQLPVVLQPTAPAYLIESINSLHIGTQSPTLALTPEDWYYTR